MNRAFRWHIGSLVAVAALLLTCASARAQACFGDCNNSGTLTASDIGRINQTILKCGPCAGGAPGGVATGCPALASGCTAADFNTDGCLKASELGRANQNILKFQPSGCGPTLTPTGGADPTPTPTTGAVVPKCGNGVIDAGEQCDNGGACFSGSAIGQLCTSDAQCPGGGAGSCKAFGGAGCASNCTTEKTLTYVFSGAICKGGAKNLQSCEFKSACVGGPLPGRPCSLSSDCTSGAMVGTCVSECGADSAGCFGDGECTTAGTGVTVGAQCYMIGADTEAKFCSTGANAGKACNADDGCPGGGAGSCKNTCGTGGVCENKSRSALTSLSLPINIGPQIGGSAVRYGAPNADGTIPVVTHEGDTVFAPVKVPGLVCACVRGGVDAASHGPNNTGSGIINCGANPIANDVTLAMDHNTAQPNRCTSGANIGLPCTNKCAAGGTRAGLACLTNNDCPGTTSGQRQCNAVTDCGSATGCNLGNGPGRCVGGVNDSRACYNNSQCPSPGKCVGKCISGPMKGGDCSCDGTSRFCDNAAQCGAAGSCRVTGNGGGFCMGPVRFCVGGTKAGKACFRDGECPDGGTCPGTGNFLAFCDSNDDCPGSLCNSIDDASCNLQDPLPPAGSGAKACLEQRQICTGGTLLGQPCTSANQCGTGGQCGVLCNARSDHPGACNSPAHITLSGAGGSGAGFFLNTISIGTISDGGTCGFAALCIGGANDLKACLVAGDCPGGACASAICAGTCAGGSSEGKACLNNSDCGAGTCSPGANFKASCTSSASCGGSVCTPVTAFAAAGTPLNLGPGKGLDGIPCTVDDDASVRGNQNTIPQTTGRTVAFISDVANNAGQQYVHRNCIESPDNEKCKGSIVGSGLNCASLMGPIPTAAGLRLASAFVTLDGQTGDAVVSTFLTAK